MLKEPQVALSGAEGEEEVIASLPRCGPVPTTYQDCVDSAAYDLFGHTPEERAAGVSVSHEVLHITGDMLNGPFLDERP